MDFYLNKALDVSSNFVKEELSKIANFILKNQCPIKLIQTKIKKFLEAYKIDKFTFEQNQMTKINTNKNSKMNTFLIFRQFKFSKISKTNNISFPKV